MVDHDIRLHLGCGIVYRPGYLNIDVSDHAVSDLQADALRLPFAPGSVSAIEAYHLVEHFDLAHCRLVLAHWFRLLRSGGTLVLETPDLEKAFREFLKAKGDRKRQLLQWVYGIKGGGMEHRAGFDPDMLGTLLRECGFVDILNEKPVTHLYESGMRASCRKPGTGKPRFELLAEFGGKVARELKQANDSMELIPLETNCLKEVREMVFHQEPGGVVRHGHKGVAKGKAERGTGPVGRQTLSRMLAKAAVCSPVLARLLLETAGDEEFGALFPSLGSRTTSTGIRSVIVLLEEMEFHRRLFSLWEKARKTPGSFSLDFESFRKEKEARVVQLLDAGAGGDTRPEKVLEYIARQPPEDIDFFHGHTVQYQARLILNRGIQEFDRGRFPAASELLCRSTRLNPDDPLVHWNLARVGRVLGEKGQALRSGYELARKLAVARGRRAMAEAVKRELRALGKDGDGAVPAGPVSELTGA